MKKLICFCFALFCLVGVLFGITPKVEADIPLGLNFGMTEDEINNVLVKYGFIKVDSKSWYGGTIDWDGLPLFCYFVMVKYDSDGCTNEVSFMLEKGVHANMYANKYKKYYTEHAKLPVWYLSGNTGDFMAMSFQYRVYDTSANER